MSEYFFDPESGTAVINDADIDSGEVYQALRDQHPEMAAMVRWTRTTNGSASRSRNPSLFDRDRFVTPEAVFDQMLVAYDAAENDDVVSGVLETTEALAFSKMSIQCDDEDEEDVWNQFAEDVDFDARLREMWREASIVSQVYAGVWWGQKTYKVGGKTKAGVKRKKTYENLTVPTGITVLDPLKVVPVGNLLFNKEQLAYIADRTETDAINQAINGEADADPIFAQLIVRKYKPSKGERKALVNLEIPVDRLYLLNPKNVFRWTSTRSQYQRWATIRMKSVFELLDLKHQLRAMDRAHLIGGTNFIVLIKKGTDDRPAGPSEVANLQAQVRTMARAPVLVGDHRLFVEIITPKLDSTLQPERYNGLDARITARLYGMFMTGNFAAGAKGDDSIKLARVIARAMESRRHMLRRALEKFVLKATYDRNDQLTEKPKLRFHPKRIALDFDPALATYLLDLFSGGNLSRESLLEEADYDQGDEARRKKSEKQSYKDVFVPDILPAGTPGLGPSNSGGAPADPKTAGRTKGGVKSGGGAAPGSGQGQAPKRPRPKPGGTSK